MEKSHTEILGRGVYSAAESVRLANFRGGEASPSSVGQRTITSRTLSRWLKGYDYEAEGEIRHSPALWQLDYDNEEAVELSFRDLIELKIVKSFRDLGLSLQTIRTCLSRASDIVGDARPFSTKKFRSDGKTIFLDITSDLTEGELVDLRDHQKVFSSFVAPSFHDVEFDATTAVRWFPLGLKRPSIVLDPSRGFGRPILADVGVPAEVIANSVIVEGSPERVARLFEVNVQSVKDAITFQQKLAA